MNNSVAEIGVAPHLLKNGAVALRYEHVAGFDACRLERSCSFEVRVVEEEDKASVPRERVGKELVYLVFVDGVRRRVAFARALVTDYGDQSILVHPVEAVVTRALLSAFFWL